MLDVDQAVLAAPAEDGGLLGSHMVTPVRVVVVRAQTRSGTVVEKTLFSCVFFSHLVVTGATCFGV